MSPLRIVIVGGSGQVGQILARHFHAAGHAVTVLARQLASAPWRTGVWDGRSLGNWVGELDGASVVINVAGRNVNCRYTEANKRAILQSRTETTALVGAAIAMLDRPPRVWLNASTATIYRHALDRPMDEATGGLGGSEPDAPASWAFSIEVARKWEQALFSAPVPDTRRVALRSAVVMSPDKNGIFDVLLGLVRAGLGGTAGSGSQYVSWIHDADFVRSIDFLIEHGELNGPVNLCAPQALPNRDFMREIRRASGTRIGLPASGWMLALGAMLMRTETELVLKSRWVSPGVLLGAGFQFQFPTWPAAVDNLIARRSNPP